MLKQDLKKALRFYFITDDKAPAIEPFDQVKIAIRAGATIIQYRNKTFSSGFYREAEEIRDFCKCNGVPFIVNDNILLAKALTADGVHLGQDDESPAAARKILGAEAIIGISVSNIDELGRTVLSDCDYIGAGPVFATSTKEDAKKATGLSGLQSIAEKVSLPVVAIGGITEKTAQSCFLSKAVGIAVISSISRASDPLKAALKMGLACSCRARSLLQTPWNDEFGLIEKLLKKVPAALNMIVPPGDDACLLAPVSNPVVTTDTQREGVHFRLNWQTPEEVGIKAVEVTLSDLAACYARPVTFFINLSLPSYVSDSMIEEIYKGVAESLNRHECSLGGGNISEGNQLSLDLFAVGAGRNDIFPKRSNARPGYGLYCTGPLGLARAGLESLIKNDPGFKDLILKFKLPEARFDAAQILAEAGVDCVMDISDGLAGDAGHIAKASGITIELDLMSCPFDTSLVSFCRKFGKKPEEIVLAGGEDYELLFACRPNIYKTISKKLKGSYKVGRCLPFTGKPVISIPGIDSFQHGKKP
ncbi:MAG: thiamine-phosphate kinase [Desulfobacteraceae bacterium]|nr:MAG: thiamine-phosphate kinase [Desulfobacteraceae bacterium]